MQLADNEALCAEIKLTFFLKKKKFNGSCSGKPLRATVTHLTNTVHIFTSIRAKYTICSSHLLDLTGLIISDRRFKLCSSSIIFPRA